MIVQPESDLSRINIYKNMLYVCKSINESSNIQKKSSFSNILIMTIAPQLSIMKYPNSLEIYFTEASLCLNKCEFEYKTYRTSSRRDSSVSFPLVSIGITGISGSSSSSSRNGAHPASYDLCFSVISVTFIEFQRL